MKLIGPFAEVLTLDKLPVRGPLKDEQLQMVKKGGILVKNESILQVGNFEALRKESDAEIEEVTGSLTAFPGFVDCHTHICFGGSRAKDFAARNSGKTYQEIASAGGGIWDTVTQTREADQGTLENTTADRLNTLLRRGVTTVEIKSGYGLGLDELKILRAIQSVAKKHRADIVSTCLAAHIVPGEFQNEEEYLTYILNNLEPFIEQERLTRRFDIFIEENAFSKKAALPYLLTLKKRGYDLTVHGDQFSTGGSEVAIECGALSVDHLEASGDTEVAALSKSTTVPVVLPGASLGLGLPFGPARRLLDAGCGLAIASDWNPGSAPNGNLLTQAALLGTYEKMSAAEVFAAITYRSARALNLFDRGVLKEGMVADITAFPTDDYREVLYHQGEMQPAQTWKRGQRIDE